jgi:hypothetical protein
VTIPIVPSTAVTAGELLTIRLPAGWFFKWNAVTATIATVNIVTC